LFCNISNSNAVTNANCTDYTAQQFPPLKLDSLLELPLIDRRLKYKKNMLQVVYLLYLCFHTKYLYSHWIFCKQKNSIYIMRGALGPPRGRCIFRLNILIGSCWACSNIVRYFVVLSWRDHKYVHLTEMGHFIGTFFSGHSIQHSFTSAIQNHYEVYQRKNNYDQRARSSIKRNIHLCLVWFLFDFLSWTEPFSF